MSTSNKEQFLLDQIFSMTLAATVQRSLTYQSKADEDKKDSVRRTLRKSLVELSVLYRNEVSETVHCANIEKLANSITNKHGNVLHKNKFRIGSAQKALNLYLKYLWCLGLIVRPPHCPIDSIILAHIDTRKNIKWTQLDDIDKYKDVIFEAQKVAKQRSLSIAEWELQFYNSAQPNVA